MKTVQDAIDFLEIEIKKLEQTGDPERVLKGIKWVYAMLKLEV